MSSGGIVNTNHTTMMNGTSDSTSSSSSPLLPSVRRPHVLVLGIDGCRPDCVTLEHAPTLWNMMHGKQDDGRTTTYSMASQVGDICWSGPGWTSCCTGVWRDKHGVSGNTFPTQQFDKYPNIFQRLKTFDPSLVTASVVNWKPINDFILLPSDHSYTYEENDAEITTHAMKLLKEQEKLDALFVHLDDVDLAGHTYDYGLQIPEYVASIEKTDERIALILQTLKSRPWYSAEDWLIVVTTDHGGIDYTHETGQWENRTNFIIVNGEDCTSGEIFPAPLIVDVAPTVLVHMGLKISSSWHLDGRPIGLKLSRRGRLGKTFINLDVSQDPENRFPIPKEELEEGPAPEDKTEDAIAAALAPVAIVDSSSYIVPASSAAAASSSSSVTVPASSSSSSVMPPQSPIIQ